ncbi:hypothetical protein FQA39_LY12783 [Lamprigera yunnana]|nr:hypothetical protein FQA39_LY12783 [Lamprigera yunnana]
MISVLLVQESLASAIARELAKYDKKVVVLEADARVAMETSAGNSGLVHGGFDPTPGKLNAKLNQLVVAFNQEEQKHLDMLYKRGLENGLDKSELEMIDQKELRLREPNISHEVVGGISLNGVDLFVNSKVIEIKKESNKFIITTSKKQHFVAECYKEFDLVARRGEYRVLEKTEAGIVNSVIFMVPTIHGKGVIVAPMLDGHVLVGPTAEENIAKDETRLVTPQQYEKIGEIGKKLIS